MVLEDGGKERSPPVSTLPKLNYVPPSSSFTFNSQSLSILLIFLFHLYFAINMAKFQMGKVEHQLKALWVVAAGKEAKETCLVAWGAVSDQFESVGGKVEA